LLPTPRGSSQRALHTYGTFVQYAGVACYVSTVPTTYNANAYAGIQFYVKGAATALKLIVQTASTWRVRSRTHLGGMSKLRGR
jgi:hypothetical protein